MPLYAICPFFMYEKNSAVGCELQNMRFRSYKDKKNWMFNHCCSWDYEECKNSKILMKKYEQQED